MNRITKPSTKVSIVFPYCISFLKREKHRARFTSCLSEIVAAEEEFERHMENKTVGEIVRGSVKGDVSRKELIDVYTKRMVPSDTGRVYYDNIVLSATFCPVCAYREVSEVDHYLPKKDYPKLAVVLSNLIPICPICNKDKGTYAPTDHSNALIHPYFDSVQDEKWLSAILDTRDGLLSVQYFVTCPAGWVKLQCDRVNHHFEFFKLADLYAKQAARKLPGIRKELTRMADSGVNASGIMEFLERGERSAKEIGSNYWECVFFRTLADSEWFCQGGFRFPVDN